MSDNLSFTGSPENLLWRREHYAFEDTLHKWLLRDKRLYNSEIYLADVALSFAEFVRERHDERLHEEALRRHRIDRYPGLG